jgi:hypothetical protein
MDQQVTVQALGQVLTSVGLSATLILFFVWQAWRREERGREEARIREEQWEARELRVVDRLQHLEDFTRTTLINLTEKTSVALAQNTLALQKNAETATQCANAISGVAADLKEHHSLAMKIAEQLPPQTK